jgi:hypothetical protein
VLSICDDVLKIERGGRARDIDYIWNTCDIKDIRLCAASPDRIYTGISSLLQQTLINSDDVIRISVMSRSGTIDDVFVVSDGKHWIDALEQKLRAHLGVS